MKMKTVKVGVVYQMLGFVKVEVPAKLKTNKAILKYVQSVEEDISLPTDGNYLDDSFEIDSIDGICKEEIELD